MFNIVIKTPNIYPSIILPFAISLLMSNNNSDKNANIKNIISKQINTFLYEINFRIFLIRIRIHGTDSINAVINNEFFYLN